MCSSDFKEVTIDDRLLFEKYADSCNIQIGDLSFTSLFAWRKLYKPKFIEKKGFLCVISEGVSLPPFAYSPIGPDDPDTFSEVVAFLKEYFRARRWKFKFKLVPENELLKFRQLGGYGFKYSNGRENSDYIYLMDEFTGLRGKAYEDKRRQVNWFKKNYRYEYININNNIDVIGDCFTILEEWCSARRCGECYPGCEKIAVAEILNNFNRLGCTGAMVKVDGRPKAFILTERLNSEIVVSHVEKADRTIKGLYSYLNREHYVREYRGMKYINLEEDMGIEGLRKSKLSYKPVRLINKYEINAD